MYAEGTMASFILPDNVPANEFLNLERVIRLSTSRNWAVWLHEYLDEFPGKEDVLRYVLCAAIRLKPRTTILPGKIFRHAIIMNW
jgi:methionyl-tRNA synthetase